MSWRRLHLAAGQVLAHLPKQEQERRAAEIARHFRLGRVFEQAIVYTMLAGDRAESLFAYEDAQRHFHNAVELASASSWQPSDTTLKAKALSRLGRVLDIAERYDEALDVLEQAAEIYRAQSDLESEVSNVAEIGWIHHNRRTHDRGIARIRPLIATLEEQPPSAPRDRMLAILHTALARLLSGVRRYSDELEAAECAAEAARAVGDDDVLAVAESRRGAALMSLGRRDEAREALSRASVLAEARGNLGTLSVVLDNLGEIAYEGGDYRRTRAEFERAIEVAEQPGLPGRLGWTLVKLGRIQLLMGEWQPAKATFERSAQLFEEDDRSALYPRIHLAQIGVVTGESRAAVKDLEAATKAAAWARDRWLVRYGSMVLAELELLEGRPMAARDRLVPLLEEQGRDEPHAILLFSLLAWAYLDSDREDDSEQTLAEGMERARLRSHQVARCDLLHVQGMLRSRQGRWEEAQFALDEAIDIADHLPDPYREAQSRAERGALAARMGDRITARKQGDQGRAIARGIGAHRCALYIERLMPRRSAEPRAGR